MATTLDVADDGLSEDDAAARLEEHGPNQLEADPGPDPARILLNQLTSPLIDILVVAGVVALAVGELVDEGLRHASCGNAPR